MKFGIMFANTGHGSSPEGATAVATAAATAAEAGGFEAIWTVEHVVVPSGYESQYPYDPSGKMAVGAEEFAALNVPFGVRGKDHGRDPGSIEMIAGAGAPPGPKLDARIGQLAEIGVTHAVVPTSRPDALADIGESSNAAYGEA